MNYAYSTNAYLNYSLSEALPRIASLGYSAVEILADVPHAYPAGLLPQQIDAIKATLAETSLKVANVNAFMLRAISDPRQPYWHPSWIEPCADYRAIRREHTLRCLPLAKAIGAPSIQTEPGGPLPEGMSRSAALDRFCRELAPCLALAESLEVSLLIEPEPDLLIERFDQYLELWDKFGSNALGLNFDIGHAYCMSEAPEEWIPKMAKHTRHYHIEDIAATRKHAHLIPGEGAIDFPAVLQAIEATNYEGYVTVELYPFIQDPDNAGKQALQHLQQCK